MGLRGVAVAAVLLLALLAGGVWLRGGLPLVAAEARRPIGCFRMDRMPPGVPPAWRALLEEELRAAPTVSLLDPEAAGIVRGVFQSVPWVDPATIEVASRPPEGLRVLFRPRTPALLLQKGGERHAVVGWDGTVLPAGLPGELPEVLELPVDASFELPAAGRRVADPLVNEALRAAPEAYAIRHDLGLDLQRIERQPGYPLEAPGVPPALSFVLEGGCEIRWGRSEAARATLTPPLALKMARLAGVAAARPGLAGIRTLILDRERPRALDERGEELPLPEGLP